MNPSFPCIRHGHASTRDPRLIQMLENAATLGLSEPDRLLSALLDYDGQLWATWHDDAVRAANAEIVKRAWVLAGGERGTLHLVRSADDYDYQEDCMNDASP